MESVDGINRAMQILENISLRSYNSFGFDISARYFAEVVDYEGLHQALDFVRENDLSLLIIGGGSNLILTADIDGLVLVNRLRQKTLVSDTSDHAVIKAGAGENWHEFVLWCLEQGYSGLENLSLIPGTVGAAPMQNIGAYGVELKDLMLSLEALNLETREIEQFSVEQCQFGYRDSVFKSHCPGRYLILSVSFRLNKHYAPVLHYGGIANQLAARGIVDPSARQVSDLICAVRSAKLPDPLQIGNAGSFFKNPVIGQVQCDELSERYPGLVSFPDRDGYRKLAAGWLIDQAGWKGWRSGDAGVYDQQALVLVNYGQADGEAILELAGRIQEDVYQRFGVMLEIEPRCYP